LVTNAPHGCRPPVKFFGAAPVEPPQIKREEKSDLKEPPERLAQSLQSDSDFDGRAEVDGGGRLSHRASPAWRTFERGAPTLAASPVELRWRLVYRSRF
jgi:hypothetical protein